MNDLLGLPADLTTALTVIVTGVLIPAISAVLNQPNLSSTARRLIPIGLAAVGAAVVLVFRAGGPVAEQAATYVVLFATLVGIAQGLYAAMPKAWKSLEASTSPSTSGPTHRAELGDDGVYSVEDEPGDDAR